ncbi:Uma2 family endonuclease [Scytonema hofmannii FACHB-248]|uniref:Uma2 family endonuclease n=1 Tax=Scytonema hofmannii FACHB-248 TaxID=1842502 RepID=A0ABR8H1X2_9CYAN|nr:MULTISPECIES: Uma2 family endonuclease [Nostocales]MBD2609246.1 Uma2 family endonuclease [Scytonema hofmannii FACHB-248]
MEALQIALPSTLKLNIDLTDEQYFQLCQNNRDYRFEHTASGELLIMPPTGSDTGRRNVKITTQLDIWNSQNNLGEVFDSSTGFTLPNGAKRSPDASWVKIERWNALTIEQQESFAPLTPDFVIELRSRTDSLKELQDKMQEYIDNGTKLGWLIDRKNKRVEIYRPAKDVEILENPINLSGEDVLPGFVLNLTAIL